MYCVRHLSPVFLSHLRYDRLAQRNLAANPRFGTRCETTSTTERTHNYIPHREIKGRFRKRGGFGERTLVPVFVPGLFRFSVPGEHANVPSFWFSFWGKIRTYPRSGFRSGGTSAKTTLLETTLLPCPSFPCFFGKRQGKPPKKQGFFIPPASLTSLEKKGNTIGRGQVTDLGVTVLHFLGPMKSRHFPWNCPPQFQGK